MGHFRRQNAHTYEHFIFQNAPNRLGGGGGGGGGGRAGAHDTTSVS
jgi:hypothetical protein